MKWPQIKTILIAVLLIINLFLLYNIAGFSNEQGKFSSQTVADAANILKSKGIDVDKTVLNNSYDALGVVNFLDVTKKAKNAGNDLLGKDAEYSSADGVITLKLKDGSYFKYDKDCKLDYVSIPNTVASGQPTDDEASRAVTSLFKTLGFPQTYYAVTASKKIDSGIIVSVTQKEQDRQIFGTRLDITVTKKGVSRIQGVWYFGYEQISRADEKDMLNVLLNVAAFIKEKNGEKIHMAEQGFSPYIDDKSGNVEVSMLSAWHITTDIGDVYYDAVSGSCRLGS